MVWFLPFRISNLTRTLKFETMKTLKEISQLDFNKSGGLIPAIIQDAETQNVLMLGYMNSESLAKTQVSGKVTFFSRSKDRLWTKGEESGNFLNVVSIGVDCDNDTLLIKVNPVGPVCHTGSDTCFDETNVSNDILFLSYLQDFIDRRKIEMPEDSYTTKLFREGTRKIAQKVGEEAVETIVGAMANDDENLIYEASDLLYHLIVLLSDKGHRIEEVVKELKSRHK